MKLPETQKGWDIWVQHGIHIFTEIDTSSDINSAFPDAQPSIGASRVKSWVEEFKEFAIFSSEEQRTFIGNGLCYTVEKTLSDIKNHWTATLIGLELIEDINLEHRLGTIKKTMSALKQQNDCLEEYQLQSIYIAAMHAAQGSVGAEKKKGIKLAKEINKIIENPPKIKPDRSLEEKAHNLFSKIFHVNTNKKNPQLGSKIAALSK